MDLAMFMWHSNNVKVILRKFANYYYLILWTFYCVDCIPFSCINFFHMAHMRNNSNFHLWSNLHLCGSNPIKSVLFFCPSVCLSIFLRMYSLGFPNFLHEYILPYILKSDKAGFWKIVFFSLDNWVNETNLYQKCNIWHFNESNITFCVLNDAA